MSKIIFITGASRGMGKIWANALLKEGNKVVITARDISVLDEFIAQYGENVLALSLDVTNSEACFEAVEKAVKHFGKIDVLINNAGYGLFGAVEEVNEEEVRAQFETNVFGSIWVTQAVLPIMRAQQSGHIIQISSALGLVATPTSAMYTATKWAIEGFGESLALEVAGFGIKVTLVEPNAFATDFSGSSAAMVNRIEAYQPIKEAYFASFTDDDYGNPNATADAIVKLVNSEEPPVRLMLGKMAFPWVSHTYAERLSVWEKWQDVSVAAHG